MLPHSQHYGQQYGFSPAPAQQNGQRGIGDSWISTGYASQGQQRQQQPAYSMTSPLMNNIILESPLVGSRRAIPTPAYQQPHFDYRLSHMSASSKNSNPVKQFSNSNQVSNQASPVHPYRVNTGLMVNNISPSQAMNNQVPNEYGLRKMIGNSGHIPRNNPHQQNFTAFSANQSPMLYPAGLHGQQSRGQPALQMQNCNEFTANSQAYQGQQSLNASPELFSKIAVNGRARDINRPNIRSVTPRHKATHVNPLKSPQLRLFRPQLDKNKCDCGRTEEGLCEFADQWLNYIIQAPKDYDLLRESYYAILRKPLSFDDEKQIGHDVSRTFPDLMIYSEKSGETNKLSNILKAFASQHPEFGYVQGMNFIVASLLFHIQEEYLTFWVFSHLFSFLDMQEIYRKGSTTFIQDFQDFTIMQNSFQGTSRSICQICALNLNNQAYRMRCTSQNGLFQWLVTMCLSKTP